MRCLIVTLCAILLSAVSDFAITRVYATETDQFTLPDKPLDDIGPDFSARVVEILRDEIAKINKMIDESTQGTMQAGVAPLDEQYLAAHFYEQVGPGLPESTLEREFHYRDFPGRNVRFQPSYLGSVYVWWTAPSLTVFFFAQCPTIRAYGVEFGTDKIGHIVQQGYEYFVKYNEARAKGASEAEALDAVVKYGAMTEDTFFGILMDGVYSNGDLAANYAGFKFYLNLLHDVKIGDRSFAPIVQRDGAHWALNPDRANGDLLKPYISEQLNEAYNPSKYVFNVELLRRHIRARCENWLKQVPDFNEQSYRAHLEGAKLWFGEDYGWDLPEREAATLLECFKDPAS